MHANGSRLLLGFCGFIMRIHKYRESERVAAGVMAWLGAYMQPGTKINKKRLAD